MILGTGTDLVEIGRIRQACGRGPAFERRVLTERERAVCAGSISRIAGNFAVKESVAKALGTGFAGFGMTDIEVLRDEKGRPCAVLRGGAERRFRELGGRAVHVSISDTKEYCIAVAILEG